MLPTGSALAVEPSAEVAVAALVERADGRLSVVRSTQSSASRADAVVRQWRARGDVRAAAVVHPVRALGTPDPLRASQWGLDRLQAETAWSSGLATGEVVAVLDTGVDAAHPDLAGVVAPGRDLVAGTGTAGTDPHGHGTHVAGVIAATAGNGVGGAGLAQGARILPVRVLDEDGGGTDAAVAEGVLWAVDNGATVVNLSLGGPSPSAVLDGAVRYALGRGVVVVAASGNEGEHGDPVLYPAATPGVLAVGAVDSGDVRPAWSSSGSHVGVVAPGVGVLSTVPGGGHESWQGTSMAAPFAAAAVALLQASSPALSPSEVVARLMATAQDRGAVGRDALYGAGVVDVVAARRAAVTVAPAPAPPAPLVVRTSRSAALVTVGQPVVLGARVLLGDRPVAGKTVTLQRRVGYGAWTVARRGVTDANGLVRWSLLPDRTGTHRFVVGTVTTGLLRVDVRQAVASSVSRGGSLVVATATVRPGGLSSVALQVARSTGWVTVATATTDTAGRVRLVRGLARGTRVRLAVAARPHLLPTVTGGVLT